MFRLQLVLNNYETLMLIEQKLYNYIIPYCKKILGETKIPFLRGSATFNIFIF